MEKGGSIKYRYTHTCTASFGSGASGRRCQERYMSTQHPKKGRMVSKKGHPDTCGQAAATKKKGEEKEGFSLVSLDESFFFFFFCDSLVRRVYWQREKTHS